MSIICVISSARTGTGTKDQKDKGQRTKVVRRQTQKAWSRMMGVEGQVQEDRIRTTGYCGQ